MKEGYWGKYWRRRVSRRRVLAGGATLAAGSAAILAGCGDDDDDDDAAAPAATQAAATQAAAAAADDDEPADDSQAAETDAADEPEEQAAAAEDRSRYGGTFNYSLVAYPTGFDPSITITFPQGMSTTYSQLMAFSITEDEFYPDAAQSWEQVDPETLVFNLRPGVRFNPRGLGRSRGDLGGLVHQPPALPGLPRQPRLERERAVLLVHGREPGRDVRHAGRPDPPDQPEQGVRLQHARVRGGLRSWWSRPSGSRRRSPGTSGRSRASTPVADRTCSTKCRRRG